jgi:hypothetical protein
VGHDTLQTLIKSIIGLFNDFAEAKRVIPAFVAHGVPREAISIVANCAATSVGEVFAAGAWGVNIEVGAASRGQPAALIELGVPDDEAQWYAEGIGRGRAFVSVVAADHLVEQALKILAQSMGVNLAMWAAR